MEKKQRILFTTDQIKEAVKRMGKEISDYYDGPIVAVSLLRGSFIFAADLVREIKLPTIIDFMTTSSYEDRETSTGVVDILHDVRYDLEGKDVLIIDDICDSGYTMLKVVEHLKTYKPKSIRTAVLLDKPSRREVELVPDFVGIEIDDVFIVGYGLNYGDFYRNVPYIFTFED